MKTLVKIFNYSAVVCFVVFVISMVVALVFGTTVIITPEDLIRHNIGYAAANVMALSCVLSVLFIILGSDSDKQITK